MEEREAAIGPTDGAEADANHRARRVMRTALTPTGTLPEGIDTIKDGNVYLIDNKAYTESGSIGEASSLTENLDYNIRNQVRPALERFATDETLPEPMRANARRALDAIEQDDVTKAVTAVNLAPDDQLKTGVTEQLGDDVEFIDLMGAREMDRSELPRSVKDILADDGSRFVDDELEGYYRLYVERMAARGADVMSRTEWVLSL